MILNHLWGLYAHPRQEWQSIEQTHEGMGASLTHIFVIALIPAICGFFASSYIGWSIGAGEPIKLTQAVELSAYTATPLFMVGFATLYPELWFVMVVGLGGIAYSVYLLYSGVPIIMNIPEERGFIYASSLVTCGLVLLVAILAASVILWNVGFGPSYIS